MADRRHEIELKFSLSPETGKALSAGLFEGVDGDELVSTYFDTPERARSPPRRLSPVAPWSPPGDRPCRTTLLRRARRSAPRTQVRRLDPTTNQPLRLGRVSELVQFDQQTMAGDEPLPAGLEMTFRPAGVEDLAYCYRAYAEGMREHVETLFGWDETEQQSKFALVFQPREARIICGRIGSTVADVGWIQVEAEPDHLHVKELHIVSGSRGLGLGSWALRQIIDEAAAAAKDVRLATLLGSPALRFYRRLGFQITDADHGVIRLERERGQ
jgi:ribosomal protein S18 acetylase RimI-like enzyme